MFMVLEWAHTGVMGRCPLTFGHRVYLSDISVTEEFDSMCVWWWFHSVCALIYNKQNENKQELYSAAEVLLIHPSLHCSLEWKFSELATLQRNVGVLCSWIYVNDLRNASANIPSRLLRNCRTRHVRNCRHAVESSVSKCWKGNLDTLTPRCCLYVSGTERSAVSGSWSMSDDQWHRINSYQGQCSIKLCDLGRISEVRVADSWFCCERMQEPLHHPATDDFPGAAHPVMFYSLPNIINNFPNGALPPYP